MGKNELIAGGQQVRAILNTGNSNNIKPNLPSGFYSEHNL